MEPLGQECGCPAFPKERVSTPFPWMVGKKVLTGQALGSLLAVPLAGGPSWEDSVSQTSNTRVGQMVCAGRAPEVKPK